MLQVLQSHVTLVSLLILSLLSHHTLWGKDESSQLLPILSLLLLFLTSVQPQG